MRAHVVARERGLCRAWVDGHRFAWCVRHGMEMHEVVPRGFGGAHGQVSIDNSILLCSACHEKRHGVGAWLRILLHTSAEDPHGVIFLPRRRAPD